MSDDKQVLKLADFGNASPVHEQWSLQFTRNKNNLVVTIRWTAPEIMCDDTMMQGHTYSSDVYSLGMTILEIATGKIPFFGHTDRAVCFKLLSKQYLARPEQYFPLEDAKSDRLWSLMVRCWDYDAKNRPSASEVRDELESISKL
ncbi:unnamed protein product [Rhizoctonia solani]|uniref:Protein kinase domain-containing protein n=1 Tax=Rhizoctonia solani TaxID=456999 RepID=A0A8H2WRU3_9AGAM|nr:unnamed protein product [Rhizoctonia solani]